MAPFRISRLGGNTQAKARSGSSVNKTMEDITNDGDDRATRFHRPLLYL